MTVQVRDVDLNIVGTVETTKLNFTLHKMYANIGTWELNLPATHSLVDALDTPGSGVVVKLNGTIIASGPTLNPEVTQRYDDPKGMVQFVGVTDTVAIQDALAYPDPANSPSNQSKAQDKRTGAAETLMHGYVNDNIGPGAIASRQKPHLTMGSNGGRGKTVTRKPRFNNLGGVIASLAKAGRLGFEIIQSGSSLVFKTYAIQDKSATVALSVEDGSITQSQLSRRPLSATNVIVGGKGHGAKRKFRGVSTTDSDALSAAWGRRIEVYMDYRGADETPEATDLVDAGQDFLDDETENPVQLKISPSEQIDYAYGNQWQLGDKIKVKVRGKDQIVTATGLLLKVDENGARYAVTLGDPVMGQTNRAGAGIKAVHTQRTDRPGHAEGIYHWSDHAPTEIPDLTDYALDGLDYVVDHRVLLLENGQTVDDVQTASGVTIQVGTIVFEKA